MAEKPFPKPSHNVSDHAYGIDALSFNGVAGDGSGQTIAIVDAYNDPTIASDLRTFDQAFGLSDPRSWVRPGAAAPTACDSPVILKNQLLPSTTVRPATGGWAWRPRR